MTENRKPNRLIHQKSPYLLQHANNPVDWYPWCNEAFEIARSKCFPIFLSIGYSCCHWCHVMERESFEDAEVAQLLNKYFIAIKVDREERPDIDSIYMTVCQALTGHGGWPMTIIMTPDKKPFFAGTYFPKHDRMGLPGIITVLEKASQAWKENRDEVLKTSSSVIESLSSAEEATGNASRSLAEIDHRELINTAFEQYKNTFDSMHGGFGHAPKFPSPHIFFFLLRYWKMTGDETALKMTEKTLDSMRRGGIFDHIGYGFSRYSTDRSWLVPHFEKMLYDNALLAMANLETYQATGNGIYARTAEEIFTYVLRDMTSHGGGFYSAEDADSENDKGQKEEGFFYIWKPDEIRQVLGDADAGRFMVLFDITERGNFEGRSIPNTIKGSIPGNDLEFVETCRKKLFERREKRIHPFKDDKILTSWNALMIAALAMGGRILGNSIYTTAAEKAANFILSQLVDKDGRLLAVYRDAVSSLKGYADDYAFMIWSLIELYETTYKPEYLKNAIKLNSDFINLFWDQKNSGFFLYGNDTEQLITRPKEGYDGATPSANSEAAGNMVRLARLTGMYELEDRARQILKAFSGSIKGYPSGFSHMLSAAILLETQGTEVIVSGEAEKGADKLLDIVRQGFRPFTVSLHYGRSQDVLKALIPSIANYSTLDGKAAAYVCRNFICNEPVTDAQQLVELLQ
ncbi:MAG: thioredoxin domain-containing protein [Clostridiaceae bacterium]